MRLVNAISSAATAATVSQERVRADDPDSLTPRSRRNNVQPGFDCLPLAVTVRSASPLCATRSRSHAPPNPIFRTFPPQKSRRLPGRRHRVDGQIAPQSRNRQWAVRLIRSPSLTQTAWSSSAFATATTSRQERHNDWITVAYRGRGRAPLSFAALTESPCWPNGAPHSPTMTSDKGRHGFGPRPRIRRPDSSSDEGRRHPQR